MLFYVGWKPCVGLSSDQQKRALDAFARWTPPKGLEMKGFYGLVDGRGFCLCEADTPATIFAAVAPWAGIYNDYDIMPAIEIEQAVQIWNGAVAFREGR
jgi:hypothetical protein